MTTNEVEQLLNQLCTRYGFCLAPEAKGGLIDDPPHDPKTFTDAVFTLEGLDPITADRHLYRTVQTAVTEAFRASEIAESASLVAPQ